MAVTDSHTDDFRFRWRNFRSFEDTGWLTIKPLTVLIGENSSGKSSLIAPFLALSQTVLSPDGIAPIVLKGRYIDLGTYKDLISDHETTRSLGLELRYHVHEDAGAIEPVGTYPPGGFSIEIAYEPNERKVVLDELAVVDLFGRKYYSRKRVKKGYSLSGAISSTKMKAAERRAVSESRPTNFFFTPANVLRAHEGEHPERSGDEPDFSSEFSHYLRSIGSFSSSTMAFFRGLTYIGPLRQRPARHYEVSPENFGNVGSKGEHTATLFSHATTTQRKQIDRWVKAFGFGDSARLQPIAEGLASIEFAKSNGYALSIADLGFGASQVFPLIVQCVMANVQSLIIAEQPEVHLNPRLQGLLGDLFVALAKSNQHVLLETHSEHMLIRIRKLVAEGKIASNEIALYFLDCEGGRSKVRQVHIEPDGSFADSQWPTGFFDDALRESLDLAKAQMKRSKS